MELVSEQLASVAMLLDTAKGLISLLLLSRARDHKLNGWCVKSGEESKR